MCKANNKKKAFTLTELLVVVIVIGVLSAAVLPKFSKVIETRKTTEAEELMASIRTEQEKRCALDKPYIADDISRLNDIVKNPDTKNYEITLQGTGVIASSKGNYSYTLEMPSYLDGRICCRGNDCEKLNKNYPNCDEGFTYEPSPESCAGTIPPVEPEIHLCTGSDTQACGCQNKGTQSRTCNTTTGEWSDWSACSISDSCECTGEKKERQACTAGNTCGFETRTATCDVTTGEWKYGAWNTSACAAKPETTKECDAGYTGTQTRSVTCTNGSWVMGDWQGECTAASCDPDGSKQNECWEGMTFDCENGLIGETRWDANTCECKDYCPVCSWGYGECSDDQWGKDTCDGDSLKLFNAALAGEDVIPAGPQTCIDLYAASSGSSSGNTGCGWDGNPYHSNTCPTGQVGACVGGKWTCYTPCPKGGCANGTMNPMPDMPLMTDNVRVACRVVTQTCTYKSL